LTRQALKLAQKNQSKTLQGCLVECTMALDIVVLDKKQLRRWEKISGTPVWNGLTNEYHPTQVLADFLTMMEYSDKPLNQVKFAYIGDAKNNMGNSLLIGAAKMGMDFRSVAPEKVQPNKELVKEAKTIAKETGAKLLVTNGLREGVKDCDFLYSDVWVSMGEPEKGMERKNRIIKTLSD